MSLDQKKTLVRRCWQECFNKRNLALVDEFVAPQYVWHGPSQEVSGPEGIKQLITVFLTAFPDLQMTFEEQLGEGDKIASRWTVRGTHQGELFGVPPTGKQVTFTGLLISRLTGSQIAEEWEHFDQLGLLQQLGVVPERNIMKVFFIVYELTPPPEKTQEDFVRFVQEEVFPVVQMHPTRGGSIVAVRLLTTEPADKYLWLITWNGQNPERMTGFQSLTEAARQKLESCGTLISAPCYEVAARVGSAQSGSKETSP